MSRAEKNLRLSPALSNSICNRFQIRSWDTQFFSCLQREDRIDNDESADSKVSYCLREYQERLSQKVSQCVDRLTSLAVAARGATLAPFQFEDIGCPVNDLRCYCIHNN
jgi:hypothetical protein